MVTFTEAIRNVKLYFLCTADIDIIYLYTKDLFNVKFHLLINKLESVGLKHFDDLKAFINYSNDFDGIDRNIDEYNPNNKIKILIIFDDITVSILNNKKVIH